MVTGIIKRKLYKGRLAKSKLDGDTGRDKFKGARSNNNIWNTINTTIDNNKRNSTNWG